MMLRIASAVLAACLLCACQEEPPDTQVMVVIDAERGVRERIVDVDVSVKSGEGDVSAWSSRFEASITPGSGPVPWPLEVALVPRDGDTSRNYVVVARARGESGGTLAEVRAISGYVEGRSLALPLVFDAACLERPTLCEPTLTCRAGQCMDPYVPPSELLPFDPDARAGDGWSGAGGTAGASATGGGGGMDGDGSVPPGDGSAGECSDPTQPCNPNPMVDCGEACAGCPSSFLRLSDDACAPLLAGLGLSTGQLMSALNADDTSYRIELPLLGDPVTLTPVLGDDVTVEVSGVDASEPASSGSFVVRNLPLGDSTLRLTLSAAGHESRTYTLTLHRSGAQRVFIKASNTGAGDGFGHAVAIDGDTIVVGAYREDSSTADLTRENNLSTDSGAAYVFEREGATYRQAAYLKASVIEADAEFGTGVAIDGDTIAVGAPDEAGGGSVYVFRRGSSDAFEHEARLTNDKPQDTRRFGASLALRGDQLVIGAPGDDEIVVDAGAVYVYERRGSAWTRIETVGAREPKLLGFFGSSVAFDDARLLVGGTGEEFTGGAAYVFERVGGRYVQRQRLAAPVTEATDFYGDTVKIEGDTLAIGAFGASDAAPGSGAIYVYRLGADGYALEQRLGASNPVHDGHFGARVVLRGDLIITGAPDEDSGARGINGSTAVAGVNESGAGYMFVRDGDQWSQLAFIKANEPEAGDRYGFSVAADGDTLVLGSPDESSSATGVDGDPLLNDAEKSGAVYVVR